ncbi:MAG: acyltransferase [Candidatus Micrarchaeota archaeon]|nr:acyltransferase [Candidatus Micrarchaeota archaeon]
MEEEIGIQGMRGFAAIMVMCTHIASDLPLSLISAPILIMYSGYSGVELFFLISGYILMRKFQSEDYSVKGRFNALKYYIRRIFRIWPLYFIAIPIFALAFSTNVAWQQYFFIQNFFPQTFSMTPLWTLVIEELFYLVLPLWVIAFRKNWLASFIGMVGFSIGYMAFIAYGLHITVMSRYLFAQFPMFAISYALGTIIALGKTVKVNSLLIVILWLNFSLILAFSEVSWFAPVIFSLIYFLVLANLRNSKFFTNRVSHFLGSLTYPIYILSVPVEIAAVAVSGQPNFFVWIPLTVLGTIALSYVAHRYFEKPFIGFGRAMERTFGIA